MPTVSTLISEIEDILGSSEFTDADIMSVFNECLRIDLVDVLRLETKATAVLEASDKTISLPTDLYKIIAVKLEKDGFLKELPLDEEYAPGYKLFRNHLEIQEALENPPDTATLWYHRYPKEITSIDDTPDMPAQFHAALKYYYLAQFRRGDEEVDLGVDYGARYQQIKAQIDQHTRGQVGIAKKRRVVSRHWI